MPVPRSTPGGTVYRFYSALADRPHVLIAGATGSGKSVTVNGIIYALLATRSPFDCNLILLDPKMVELVQYTRLPHVLRYAAQPSDMIDALHLALKETESRFLSMQARGLREYDGPDLYVIIDELADLMVTQKAAALPPLQRLAQVGRAARVHVIACTQNVMAATIPTVLKCNFPAVLGLRTATAAQSRMLIDARGCEALPDPRKTHKAVGYLRDGADLDRYELYMYPDEEINRLISYWTGSAARSATRSA